MRYLKFSCFAIVFLCFGMFSSTNSQNSLSSNSPQYPESSPELAWILKNCTNCSDVQINEVIAHYIKSNPKLKHMCKVFKSHHKVQKIELIKAIKSKNPSYEQVAELIATSKVANQHKDILLEGFIRNK